MSNILIRLWNVILSRPWTPQPTPSSHHQILEMARNQGLISPTQFGQFEKSLSPFTRGRAPQSQVRPPKLGWYNGESFFVRHAYFTGADEPYDKLKRTLRADIDEAAWSSLYSTVSQPFNKPELGKFAVKVINHYGDEVLKVFDV